MKIDGNSQLPLTALKGEAEHGLEHHFEVQGMNNGEVTIT